MRPPAYARPCPHPSRLPMRIPTSSQGDAPGSCGSWSISWPRPRAPLHPGRPAPAHRPVRAVGLHPGPGTELGASLFVRSTRRVELTQAGLALLPEARRALAAATAAADAVAAVQGLVRGTLAVGTMQILPGGRPPGRPGPVPRPVPGGAAPAPGRHRHPGRRGRPAPSTWPWSPRSAARRPGWSCAGWPATHCWSPAPPSTPWPGGRRWRWPSSPPSRSSTSSLDWGLRMLVDRQLAAAGLDRHTALEVNDAHPAGARRPRPRGRPGPRGRHPPPGPGALCGCARPCPPSRSPCVATVGDPPASQAARVLLAMLPAGRHE